MHTVESTPLKLIAPPPVLYLGSLLLGFVIHAISPVRIFPASFLHVVLGGVLLALGAAFARWSFLTMRKHGTTADPKEPSTELATSGPFRFSRNPIYVAMTALYIGVAFIANAAWPLALIGPLLLLMHWGVIRREERYLSDRFGDAYVEYKSTVRRWL